MERIKIISTVIIFMFMGLLITSCENSGDSANIEMYGNEKSVLSIRINNTIAKIDEKIDELENRLDTAKEETAEKINDQVDKLKERREELREDFRVLNDKSDNTWKNFRSDVEQAIEDTEEWINNIDFDFDNPAHKKY